MADKCEKRQENPGGVSCPAAGGRMRNPVAGEGGRGAVFRSRQPAGKRPEAVLGNHPAAAAEKIAVGDNGKKIFI